MARVPRVADEAVRDYLEALQDPNTAVDWEEVEDLANRIADTDDPVQRVLLRAEWRRASNPETYMPQLESDFIAYARQWADANSVSADDFYYEGVPLDVLREAGMEVSGEVVAESEEFAVGSTDEDLADLASAPGVPGPPVDATTDAVPFEAGSAMAKVHQAMDREPFTINELVERTDASRSTVRATVEKLVEAGRVQVLEPLDTGTAGRQPKRYQLI